MPASPPTPKIELHVHLEGAVRPAALLDIASRNGLDLPAHDVDALTELYRFRDFDHFIELWMMTTHVIRTEADFRQVVVSYAGGRRARRGLHRRHLHARRTRARRRVVGRGLHRLLRRRRRSARDHGRRGEADARHPAGLRRRVGVGNGALLGQVPRPGRGRARTRGPRDRLSARTVRTRVPYRQGRRPGLGAACGRDRRIASIRGALDALGADRLRHGIRAVDDPALLAEIAERGVVCDVCPISNIRTRAVDIIENHPLPAMLAAGVSCSISTDDPAMFDTDLARDYDAAAKLGLTPRAAYEAGVRGALCDDRTRAMLEDIAAAYAWPEPGRPA